LRLLALKYHEKDGYKLEDTGCYNHRNPLRKLKRGFFFAMFKSNLTFYVFIGLTFIALILFISDIFSRDINKLIQNEIENANLRAIIELAGTAANEI
jgi:hypothetical protein